jgi:CBS domain containing-hemolysin-like protein
MKGLFSFFSKKTGGGETSAKTPPQMDRKTYQALESDQREMIRGVVELSDTTVKEVMVPRTDTVFLSVTASKEELLARISESEHSRFPVYQDTIDNVIGIIYVKDVLKALVQGDPAGNGAFDIKALLRKPFFVPVSKHIDDLLRELRRRRVHIAVVVDEYGGVSGIVCMEDIIEEIVGDIQDEFDHETEEILNLGEGIWLCGARVNLEDLAEEIGVEFPVEDFDTLGGFVFDLFGKIPVKYEKAVYRGNDFIVQDMDGHKINSVKIVIPKDTEKKDKDNGK